MRRSHILLLLAIVLLVVSSVCSTDPLPIEQSDCVGVIDYLKGSATTTTITTTSAEKEEKLKLLCLIVPTQFKTICQSSIQLFSPLLWKKIETQDPHSVCCWLSTTVYPFLDVEKECSRTTTITAANEIEFAFKRDQQYCTACKMALQLGENYLKNATVQERIKGLMKEKLCTLLQREYVSLCNTSVELYMKEMNDYLNRYTPDMLCTAAGLCSKNSKFIASLTRNGEKKDPLLPSDNNAVCDICEYTIGVIDGYLKDNKTRDQVKEFILYEVCKALPGQFGPICAAIVNTEFDKIVDALARKFSPRQVCQQLKLCTANIIFSKKGEKFELCPICVNAVDLAESMLSSEKTQIQKFLDTETCKRITVPEISSICSTLLYNEYDVVVNFIRLNYNGKMLCSLTGFCAQYLHHH
jgi:hypothetical protein